MATDKSITSGSVIPPPPPNEMPTNAPDIKSDTASTPTLSFLVICFSSMIRLVDLET